MLLVCTAPGQDLVVKVYMELGSFFLFLQEQIKGIIIIISDCVRQRARSMRFYTPRRPGSSFPWQSVFPSQCIERHTEELYDVQGNTSMRTPQALSRGETDEASSRSYCAQLSI